MRSARSATIHVMQALLEAAIVASLVVVLIAGTAFASKGGGAGTTGGGKHGGGGTGGGTFSLVMVSDVNGNGSPNWGDSVTYDVSKVTVTNPYITTKCYVGRTLVLSAYAGFYDGYLWPGARIIPLTSDLWTSGAADCTAALYGTSTTLSYHVGS